MSEIITKGVRMKARSALYEKLYPVLHHLNVLALDVLAPRLP